MITNLELHNWRTYDHLVLSLGPGATFIVAPNGVGKSSIIEAARFATFGFAPTRGGVHKLGATGPTRASVTIDLGNDRTLRITRTLPTKRKGEPVVDATIDDQPIAPPALDRFLSGTFGASVPFLDRMSMMSGSEVIGNAKGLDLKSHLSAFLGLGGVERAITETDRLLKSAADDVAHHRNAARISEAELQSLRSETERAREQFEKTSAAVAAAQEELRQARAAHSAARSAAELIARADARHAGLSELAAKASDLVGYPVAVDTLDDALAGIEAITYAEVDRIRRRRAEVDGRIAATTAAMEGLTGTTGACPVCRRPLDHADVEAAREGHEAEIRAWEAERNGLDEQTASEQLHRVSALRAAVLRHGPPPEIPTDTPTVEDAATAEAAAVAALDTVAMAAAESRAAAGAAEAALDEAVSAGSALDAVIAAFERQATLEATKEALTKVREILLTEGIQPLEEALQERWTNLFEHRTGLSLAGDGTVTRTVGEGSLSFDHFSDGERMAAQLLLRVLVLKATTKLPFLWIDEPLEHLDPDARRALSLLLTDAPQEPGGPLRQTVMTTYEEPLVRRLQSALAGTHVTYVRTGGT